MKIVMILLLVLVLGVGGAFASGYRFHPENLGYYLKAGTGNLQEIIFKDGNALTGSVVEDNGQQIKIDADGAGLTFSKSEIDRMTPVKGGGFIEALQKNYKTHQKIHPLFSKAKEVPGQKSAGNLFNESDRIAEKIRKDNPQMTGQAMMEAAQSAQSAARSQQARIEAQVRALENGEERFNNM